MTNAKTFSLKIKFGQQNTFCSASLWLSPQVHATLAKGHKRLSSGGRGPLQVLFPTDSAVGENDLIKADTHVDAVE